MPCPAARPHIDHMTECPLGISVLRSVFFSPLINDLYASSLLGGQLLTKVEHHFLPSPT